MIMSPLTVRITRKGQICTLAVSGELDIATTHVLARRAAEALRLPTERLIIDLSGLQFIDVCGARGLADVTHAAPPGCPVLVRGAAGPVRRILDLLALPLEQSGAVTPDSAVRPARESQVLSSWPQATRINSPQTCANGTDQAAQACQAHGRWATTRRSLRLTADRRAPHTRHQP